MTLKKIFESYDMNLEKVIVKKHRDMDISTPQMVILLVLLDMYKKKALFSMQAIARKVDYSLKEVGQFIDALIEKGYVHIYHEENKQGKTQEVFHLDQLFLKIESFLIDEKPVIKDVHDIQKLVILLEQYLNRSVSAKELQQLRYFLEEETYDIKMIEDAIHTLKDKVTMYKLERMLSIQNKLPKQAVDEKTDAALDALFRSIK